MSSRRGNHAPSENVNFGKELYATRRKCAIICNPAGILRQAAPCYDRKKLVIITMDAKPFRFFRKSRSIRIYAPYPEE